MGGSDELKTLKNIEDLILEYTEIEGVAMARGEVALLGVNVPVLRTRRLTPSSMPRNYCDTIVAG